MSWIETDDGQAVELPGERGGPAFKTIFGDDEPPDEPDPAPPC